MDDKQSEWTHTVENVTVVDELALVAHLLFNTLNSRARVLSYGSYFVHRGLGLKTIKQTAVQDSCSKHCCCTC